MDSIVITGSQKMQSWMVDILFSEPGQAKTDDTAAAASAAAAVTVASSARSTVAPATGQAIAALQAGGAASATASTASDTEVMDPKYQTVAQANATVASNFAMTSAQLSAAFYSGGGVRDPGLVGVTNTFADIVQMERNAAQIALNLANDPAAAAAAGQDPDSLRKEAAQTNAYADSMQKAFDNHTLVIQQMSDIQGLNYTQVATLGGPSPDSQPDSCTWTGSYDQEAMSKFVSQFTGDKHVGTPTIGGITLLLTWTDDTLQYP